MNYSNSYTRLFPSLLNNPCSLYFAKRIFLETMFSLSLYSGPRSTPTGMGEGKVREQERADQESTVEGPGHEFA